MRKNLPRAVGLGYLSPLWHLWRRFEGFRGFSGLCRTGV